MGNKSTKDKSKRKPSSLQKVKGELKLLTLGIAGSGKSTFIKQLKIITSGGFDDDEIASYKDILLKNIMVGMQELVKQAEKLEHNIDTKARKHARLFEQLIVVEAEWNSKIQRGAINLWKDRAIQQTWALSPGYQLQMSQMDYLMNNITRFTQEGFVPTNEDILHARQRTTGMQSYNFVHEKYRWNLIDVGGQKPERSKWEGILGSSEVSAMVWFTALDEYNMMSSEEMGKTKMQISRESFEEIINSELSKSMTLLVFLNKVDLLEKKLNNVEDRKDFKNTFSIADSQMEGLTLDQATSTVKDSFLNVVRRNSNVSFHVTNALDTNCMKSVFKAVRNDIFLHRMQSCGINY